MLEAIEEFFTFNELFSGSGIVGFKPKKLAKVQKIQETRERLALPINLLELEKEIKAFEGCVLKRFAQNTVMGEGVQNPEFLIIGEAPGEEEDLNGIPFCGRSGRLLETALNKFGIFRTKNAYITNSVFWRPPGNRKPEKAELEACRPFLERIIKITNPKLIITVGAVPIQNAILEETSVSELRKKEFNFKFLHEKQEDFKVITLYHPSYLLRNPSKKRDFYLDMLFFKKKYNI